MRTVGSGAIPLGRKPKDYDYICTYDEFENYVQRNKSNIGSVYPVAGDKFVVFFKNKDIVEFEIAWEGSTAESLLKILEEHKISNIDLVYTLKMSHRFLRNSPHFLKTMEDIRKLRKLGAEIPVCLKKWFKEREKATYTYSHPVLKVDKENFFKDDNIQYTYDHDSIHRAVATLDKPAYLYFKDDGEEVWCSKDKFNILPESVKLSSVLEESYVLALERSLVPFDFKPKPENAFKMALMKVCTSITSGWWREYAWEHYYQVLDMYKDSYVDKFKEGLEKGIVVNGR
jgi:hypothetical protein